MEDNEIVTMYLNRDETAVYITSEKYGTRLQKLALNIVQDVETAQECENDTYLAAWNSIPPHEPRRYLYAFLARITRHISLNCCRDRKRLKRDAYVCQLSAEMEQCIPTPDDVACRMDELVLREAINTFLGTLRTEQRIIFLRRYWYMDTIEMIAHRYHISESKVKTTLFRTRNQLREFLMKGGFLL